MRIALNAYYDSESQTIEIIYNGESVGESFLYLNENIIGYNCDINTTFILPTPSGSYTIEVVTESWTAPGSLKL